MAWAVPWPMLRCNASTTPLPFTLAGWREFLRLAPSSGLTFTELRQTANFWWERKIPQNLLSSARDDVESTSRRRGQPLLEDVPAPPAGLQDAGGRGRQVLGEDIPAPPATSLRSAQGHVYHVDRSWFGDTRMLNSIQPLTHAGMGDFVAKLPGGGTVTFIRYSDDVLLPKQEGRLHSLTHSAGDTALERWIRSLLDAGRVELVGSWSAFPVSAGAAAASSTTPAPLTRSQSRDVARIELERIPLAPERRRYWLDRIGAAIRVGDDWRQLLSKAQAEVPSPVGPQQVQRVFEQGGGYRIELMRKTGSGEMYTVVRDLDGRPVANLTTTRTARVGNRERSIFDNALWRDGVSAQEQQAILRRFEFALEEQEAPGETFELGGLDREADEMKARAMTLGADPSRPMRPNPLSDVLAVLAEDEDDEALVLHHRLLYWTAAMVNAPRCLGEVQQASVRAVREAFRLFQAGKRRMQAGAPRDSIVAALARIVRAAARLAADCGEGQVTLLGVPLELDVDPADRRLVEGRT